ncbi:alpha/beta hydrolase [Rhodobacter sp. TJ_12]|uniref:alpha/beta fold hydrolase n=1 Tax=Rhodobacter sp. TJ_12 TaxID=2029399 RepID=UPI001CBB76C2|nr:alpha/beta hydrolase [Rhodobacter sp. TJ_12]MBZ4023520.1 alpha/beta hydrolase [Rhodobacter sp. TJ_12]
MTEFFTTPEGHRIAYKKRAGSGPGVLFLHGLHSDMNGDKAEALDAWAAEKGRAFLRFDCSGHGESSEQYPDTSIADWYADAKAVLNDLAEGPQILVGSSMGGWLALLLAREFPQKVAALVTVAAAPDFTEDGYFASFTEDQKTALMEQGYVDLQYGPQPYRIMKKFIVDGRDHFVMRDPLPLPMPTRLLQGTADRSVPPDWAVKLLHHAQGDDIRLNMVKGADHRFSAPENIALIKATLDDLLA